MFFIIFNFIILAPTLGMSISFQELDSILPIELTPTINEESYLFFMIPIEKDPEELIIQTGQYQSIPIKNMSYSRLSGFQNNENGTKFANEYGSSYDELGGISSSSYTTNSTEKFNFDNPVIVPLHFNFEHDPEIDPELPVCSEDLRTWQEGIIDRVVNHLKLSIALDSEYDEVAILMRTKRDKLDATQIDEFNDIYSIKDVIFKIQELKMLSDIRFNQLLQHVEKLHNVHITMVAEGLSTYKLLQAKLNGIQEKLSTSTEDAELRDLLVSMVNNMAPSVDQLVDVYTDLLVTIEQIDCDSKNIIGN